MIARCLSGLRLEQMSATVTTASSSLSIDNGHTNALRGEASRICRLVQNPVQRVGFELGSDIAIQDLADNPSRDQTTTSWPLAKPNIGRFASAHPDETSPGPKQQRKTNYTLSIGCSITQTLFGAITTTTKTRVLNTNLVGDEAFDDENYQYEHESTVRILPAQWLLKLGFNYAYTFSTNDSSIKGWQFCVKPINLVPDDASIFRFCKEGNIEGVRNLISKGLASVRDVDARGQLALHVSHVALPLFDKAAFQDSLYLTPVVSMRREIITQNYADT